ncbi:MAG: hypothetical protein A2V52_01555 [Actinobacteria bacterium RBG_19FT_COMBO_54_7]|nr:MAG: hypothetical protein A2V52_01555 [Actinobacteria bacterium RBG_19FT_COMBO_54_7]
MVDQINLEDLMAREIRAEGTGYSALPGLVRELIRTPGFKELLLLHLRDINPENARELIRTVLWEDIAFSMSIIGASPKLVNWLVEALIELGVQLNNFTLDILRDFLSKMGQDLDTSAIESLPSAYAPLVNDLLLNDREALDALIAGIGHVAESALSTMGSTLRNVGNTADFGKIRVGISEHFDRRREELAGIPEIFSPVPLANLLGVVPSIANYLLRVLTRTLQALALPPEILANAIFQLLEDINQKELGGLVNSLTEFINSLHQGNLVLGRDEPRFKEVAGRISKGLVESVDGEQLKQAAIAVGEDGKVLGEVISGYLFATPESTTQVVKALHTAINAIMRTLGNTAKRMSELPASAMAELAEDFEARFDSRELGRVMNHGMTTFNKLCDQNHDMVTEILRRSFSAVNTETWALAGKNVVLQAKDAAFSVPQVSAALTPKAIGRDINAGLAAFNRLSQEKPELISQRVSETLAVIDTAALAKAVESFVNPLLKALFENTKVLMAVVKPVVGGTLKAIGGLIKDGVMRTRKAR